MCLARRLFLIERTEASGKSLSEWCAPVFRRGRDARGGFVITAHASDPHLAVQRFNGAFHGVGFASISATLTAARANLYAV